MATCFYRLLIVAVLVCGLSTCSTPSDKESAAKGGDVNAPKLSEQDQNQLNEIQAEIEIGRNMAGKLLAAFGIFQDEGLSKYINSVGAVVGQNSTRPDRAYMFEVLDTEIINAFACPGGYILITAGAVRLAENEAELAAVLGHEITHVSNQHMFSTLKKMKQEELDKAAEDGRRFKVPEEVKARQRPDPVDNEFGSMLARYFTGASGAGLNVVKAASAGMGLMLKKGLDKELEFEADQVGVRTAVNSGYDPKAFISYLNRLKRQKKGGDTKVLDETHPKIDERKDRISVLLKQMNAHEIIGAQGKERFEKYAANMPPAKKKKKS